MTVPTRRLRLDLAYDGTEFSGWAAQRGRRTVQGTLEAAIATVLRLPEAHLTVAGRTDAGVHAHGQVCHLDVPADALAGLEPELLAGRLDRVLPEEIRVRRVRPAAPGFDARFSASWRRYSYRVVDDPTALDPLRCRFVLPWPRRLNPSAMTTAGAALVGEHDFAAYCRKRAGAGTVRTLRELSWSRCGEEVVGRVVADAFCHTMVRALVGAMLMVGEGRRDPRWPRAVLDAGVRDPRVAVVPARGLTLEEVRYPPDAELAARAQQTRSRRSTGRPSADTPARAQDSPGDDPQMTSRRAEGGDG
jgi:tRNA pseudouridine38-40 synthase